ncbi:MAG: proton-conducting transporter membrane subunit [Rhodospirillaceae bacterium]
MTLAYAPFFIPIVLFAAGLICFLTPGRRPTVGLMLAQAAAVAAFLGAIGLAVQVALGGPGTVRLPGDVGLGVAIRLDVVSVAISLCVSFVGWMVVRYAATYLDGEARQGAFTAWLLLTLGAVMTLVLAGGLLQLVVAWIATSLLLHKLLLFYANRPNARRAARKKFMAARLSDAALIGAVLLLFEAYGTMDIAAILEAARNKTGGAAAMWGAALLAAAAVLKSAQIPAHGWLIEVMETPTPVSALLHAGVINAGGFLLIRLADVVMLSPAVLAALVIIGGLTALFASVVMLTQAAVKTSLAWSTVAQMGFMILECGLGLFPLALLHILAHSLYKAHSFLASGGAVERIAAALRLGGVAIPSSAAVLRAFIAALTIYAAVGAAFGFQYKSPQAIALGAILIFGVAYLFAQGLADRAPRQLTVRTALYALASSISYFVLQWGAEHLTAAALPAPHPPGSLEWLLIALTVTSFALTAVLQGLLPLWANHPAVAGLRVHISNGFYFNAVFDRMTGGWNVRERG